MSKKVIIVGGVAGGMSAATRLRRLDESATITVFEKGPYASYANCGIPYALGNVIKDDDSLILHTPKYFKERFNIDVYLNTEVTEIDRTNEKISTRTVGGIEIRQFDYDKLILAQGSRAIRPRIDGEAQSHVVTLRTPQDLQQVRGLMLDRDICSVCIIGGGFVGLEAAENLRAMNFAVSIIEQSPHVLPPVDADIAEILHAELKRHGVDVFLHDGVRRIERSHVVLASNGREIPAELVILAAGMRARTGLAKQAGLEVGPRGVKVDSHMETSDEDVYAVGDMVETEHVVLKQPGVVALGGPANRQGRLAADDMSGKLVHYRGNIGTVVCKVFDLTVGFAGLSVSALRDAGRDALWVTVHPPSHAAYYPGSHAITIKAAFEKNTGRILGVQAVGRAGVDKRIDVLATAIQAGMTVFDLEHLELGYAPPYSSAKDPVNMVGFVASNVMRGDYRIVHAEDLGMKKLSDWQVVDVRSAEEFATGHLPNAVNLAIDTLRDRVDTLDKAIPVLVYCYVGYRGYLAYRILSQKGFNVVNLDGGLKAVIDGGFKLQHS
ncbi:FAD-dependent pyridine nucleotide-disulfide oxidoreductase [Metarhizium guizhouense ARSEF 977]|uniref:FAD-dependent pyridine nucleotide-disulfide oxidoreductase n=1 Tax=Metarhizium guizhouense (strain ARSEF 977) TaxID=1276136 RepID=A0A0B4I4E9_METGA|nr:FAD-dependent pyridine nucleotide-disulfide oxidoreductase [Metarhizium guizhouense ARSEF 977]